MTTDQIRYTVKETAAAMRKALKAQWPGTKFSVRMSTGTGHGWLHVGWTDGPLDQDVRKVTGQFQSSYFDGMDDGYHQTGITAYSCCGVLNSRHTSPEAEQWARGVAVRGSYWWPDGLDPYMDTDYYATRKLLAGIDLTDGFPEDPKAAFRESWN